MHRTATSAMNKTTARATNLDTFRQACLNTDFCKPGLQWSKFITSSRQVPVLGLNPLQGQELLEDPPLLLAANRVIIHHNAVVAMLANPIVTQRVGKVGGRLPEKKHIVQNWGHFQLPAGTKTYLKNCIAWMTKASAPRLEAQWKWVRGADDDMLEKHAQDIRAFWETGRRYHIVSVSADGKCLRITLPDELAGCSSGRSLDF